MKLSWGYRILILYFSFFLMMLTFVIVCYQQNIDLVAEDYYAQELAHQSRMNEIINRNEQNLSFKLDHRTDRSEIVLSFPAAVDSGKLTLFRPDDKKLDRHLALQTSVANSQVKVSTLGLKKGLWRIQASWSSMGLPLFQEEKVYVP